MLIRGLGATVTVSLVAAAIAGAAANTVAPGSSKRPAVKREPAVSAQPFTGHRVPAAAAMPAGKRDASAWPAAAEAVVDLTAAAHPAASTASTGAVPPQRAGTLPVLLAPVTARAAAAASGASGAAGVAGSTPQRVHVRVLNQSAAAAAGVTGVVMSVAAADDAAGSGPLDVGVDYQTFQNAAGAGWADRLRLVALPECALTTPQLASCQVQTPIAGSRLDAASHTVSAPVSVPPATTTQSVLSTEFSPGDALKTVVRRTAAVPQAMVLAAVSGASGSNGDFTATSLAPSGTWSVSGASGSFTWSYPITVPPSATGKAPSLALSYDSSSVDGRTAATNNQPGWVGEGWSLDPGSIERTYRSCSDDTTLPTASQTGDQCWAGQVLSMSLGGHTTALVWDPVSGQVHPAADDGSRVQLLTGASNGVNNGEYWKVTTTDGTQYYFGRNHGPGYTNQGSTNSAWTVPVYGAHPGDPCYSSAGFSSSSCLQAWRWNLDYVEDTHGNVTMYYYSPETNYYGADNGTTGVAYTRGGTLQKIDYGIRDVNGSVYGIPTPDQVVFNVSERCIPTSTFTCDPSLFTAANAGNWPDTPQDQQCPSTGTCNNHAPTFWSTKRLTNITTQYYNGSGYTPVDSYGLTHQFPTQGDSELWLASLTRTGLGADGSSIAMPTITFIGTLMDNRVQGFNSEPPMAHWRITRVNADTGAVIMANYTPTECSAANVPSDASNDQMRCFPVYWAFPGNATPTLDWFHKYLVSSVQVEDPNTLSPQQVTSYTYDGKPAWHFDDNEVVKAAYRTYGQFRGYGQVDVRTGDPATSDVRTLTSTIYYRGMDGDTLPGGKTRSAAVVDGLNESVPDSGQFADTARETLVYTGDGGPLDHAAISDMTTVATTATRPRTGLPALTAIVTAAAGTRNRTVLAAGGLRNTSKANTYDALGRLVQTSDYADGLPTLCTRTTYADNTTSWIRSLPAEVVSSNQVCPALGTAQAGILSDGRTYYDSSSTVGAVPGPGDATRTDKANVNTNDALSFITTGQAAFDPAGRNISSTDALGHVSKTSYTPAVTTTAGTVGPETQMVTTNALNQSSTANLDPARGEKTSTVDISGQRTDAVYDQLGRLTSVWLPGHDKATQPASKTFGYLVQTTGPLVQTTRTLVDYGAGTNYVTTKTLSDAMGQVLQTQSDADGGGIVVTDSFHDSHGWVVKSDNSWYTNLSTGDTVLATGDSQIPDQSVTTYDGQGRATSVAEKSLSQLKWTKTTIYGGDRVTTLPAAGGTASTTVTDARGRTSELDQYLQAPTVNGNVVTGAAGTVKATTYHYGPSGLQSSVTDSAGNQWQYTYDFLGRKTWQSDPDSGISKFGYDNAGQLTSTTDSLNQTLAIGYDAIGRKTGEYSGTLTGAKQATWTWDTLLPGKLTSSTRYVGLTKYTHAFTGYDGAGNASGEQWQLPLAEGNLAGTYTTYYSYTSTNLLQTVQPPNAGALPLETETLSYDKWGKPLTDKAYTIVVGGTVYTPYGETAQLSLGPSNSQAWITYSYDNQSRDLTEVNTSAQIASPQIDDTTYAYDASDDLVRVGDLRGPPGSATDTQCAAYDALRRMTAAWTGTDGCATAPSAGDSSTVGGPNPYWTSWTFDDTGNRTSQTTHGLAGAADTAATYNYPAAGTPQPHTLQNITASGPSAAPSSYSYDAVGNTKTRNLSTGNQSLNWDLENRLKSVSTSNGTTSYIYDADGNQLLRKDPGTTTLFAGTDEYAMDASGTVTGTRYYSFNGKTVAMRQQTNAVQYLVADEHGTGQIDIDAQTLNVTRRAFTPFGESRGAVSGGAWPDTHGFLNKSQDSNDWLTDVGARKYDPATGRFISRDPQLDTGTPQQMNGYAYANNAPFSNSDPTGLDWCFGVCDAIGNGVTAAAKTVGAVANGGVSFAVNTVTDIANVPANVVGAFGVNTTSWQANWGHQYDTWIADNTYIKPGSFYSGVSNFTKTGLTVASYAVPGIDGFAAVSKASDGLSAMDKASVFLRGAAGMDTSAFASTWSVTKTAADAADAGDAANGLGDLTGAGCVNSFAGATPVLLAGGTSKPIDQVRVGDHVQNAYPGAATGQEDHVVTAVHVTYDDRDFTDVTVATPGGSKTITSTAHHLFYDVTTGQFTAAADLKPGDRLQTSDGTTTVVGIRDYSAAIVTYNLSIDGVHTYYVEAGAAPVLVHNCDLHDMARAESAKSTTTNYAAAVARDSYTGVWAYGESSMTPAEVHEALKGPLEALIQEHGSMAEWPPGECAEFNACNNLLLKSAAINPDEVEYATIIRQTGENFPSCDNCRNILVHNAHMREAEW